MLELIKDLGAAIGALVALIAVLKSLSELRRFGLEHQKLAMELKQLRIEADARSRLVAAPTPDEIRQLVTDPLIRELRRVSDERDSAISHLAGVAASEQTHRIEPLMDEILKTLRRVENHLKGSTHADRKSEAGDSLAASGECTKQAAPRATPCP